jgi:hypothetical protein
MIPPPPSLGPHTLDFSTTTYTAKKDLFRRMRVVHFSVEVKLTKTMHMKY